MTAVIYARYSSDSQREESIDGQLRECMAFAERQGISVIDTYIDRALSAKTDNRPQFQKMIKDSSKKKFDVIIVWKLDRFARNRYDSARYPGFPTKTGTQGIFYSFQAIQIHLQLFSSISVDLAAQWATEGESCLCVS